MATQQLFMKMAGGHHRALESGQMDLNEYVARGKEYGDNHECIEKNFNINNTTALEQPRNNIRAEEIQAWVATGQYDRILRGEYVRRGHEAKDRSVKDDVIDATNYYADAGREVVNQVTESASRAAQAAKDAFNRSRTGS